MSTETIPQTEGSKKFTINYCSRKVEKSVNNKKQVVTCNGMIVIDELVRQGQGETYLVKSYCGSCGATEEDSFKQPKIKHSENCEQAQKRDEKPFVYLQTVIYPIYEANKKVIVDYGVVWKCAGVQYPKEEGNATSCDGMTIEPRGGFPF